MFKSPSLAEDAHSASRGLLGPRRSPGPTRAGAGEESGAAPVASEAGNLTTPGPIESQEIVTFLEYSYLL